MRERVLVSWSGGKDSALAWHTVSAEFDGTLLTTVTEEYDRISMHGVRVELLRRQADALGLPLVTVSIPPRCTNEVYEERMRSALAVQRDAGVRRVVCGDIFLADVRRYREERLFRDGLSGVFPLWGVNTHELAERFITLGFRAVLCCVDTQSLDASFAGRLFDRTLLADLPPGADPCGENGEFHTFVVDGPGFARPVPVRLGERTLREGRFAYVDLLPDG
jgi:uncharacterized protein (TIGR00290 family)